MFNLCDRFTIDAGAKVRTTAAGFLVASPRVARTGIQLYRGRELGRDDLDIVRVYRSEDEVFKKTSLATFGNKPVTDDHPPVPVTAQNWKDYAKGGLGEDVLRDNQFIRVPMCVMDQGTINKFNDGKAELSVGYTCDIKWGEGVSSEGEKYDAMQTDIAVNHVAIVKAARGGPDLRIGDGTGDVHVNIDALAQAMALIHKGNIVKDSALADANEGHLGKDGKSYPILKDGLVSIGSLRAAKTQAILKGDGDILAAVDNLISLIEPPTVPAKPAATIQKDNKTMKTMTVDGITCEMSDTAIEVVQRAIKRLEDAFNFEKKSKEELEKEKEKKEAGDAIAKLTTEGATKDAQIVTLTKQVSDSVITPAKLDQLVADRKVVADKARAVLPTVVVDGKTDDEIRAQVVTANLGDLCKGWDASQMATSFATLTANAKVQSADHLSGHRPGGINDQRQVFSQPPITQDAGEIAAQKRDARLEGAWKTPGGAA